MIFVLRLSSSSTNDSDSKRSKEDEHVESDSGSIDMNEEVSDYSVVSHVFSRLRKPTQISLSGSATAGNIYR